MSCTCNVPQISTVSVGFIVPTPTFPPNGFKDNGLSPEASTVIFQLWIFAPAGPTILINEPLLISLPEKSECSTVYV